KSLVKDHPELLVRNRFLCFECTPMEDVLRGSRTLFINPLLSSAEKWFCYRMATS
ncbi:Hypothetical protein FKW44_011235, partial [Caligus rogercresseyi]